MSGFWGMDTAQVDGFGQQLGTGRTTIEQRFSDLQSVVGGIVGTQWVGPDAEQFGENYQQQVTAQVDTAVERMQSLVDELLQHLEQQDTASSADGSPFAGASASGTVEGDRPGFWERWGRGILENLMPSGMGAATTLVSAAHNLPDYLLDSVPRFVPLIGDVFTGVMAGVDRWSQESDRPFWERLGRASLDGVLTGGGSFVGGLVGAAGGAFVGVLAGGGSVGLAGTAAGAAVGGVGAIPGALAGAGTGAIVGGSVGAFVGDLVGGYVGSAIGAGLADAILD